MNDLDEHTALEIRHQEAVNEAINALHQVTRDADDYRSIFLRIGKAGLVAIQTPSCLHTSLTDLGNEWNALVSPLADCSSDEAERKYLLSLALKRVLDSGLEGYRLAYRFPATA